MDTQFTAPLAPEVSAGPLEKPAPAAGPIQAPGGVLWSRATAQQIVAVIADDAETGVLAPAEAVELIDRVWQRAGP